MANDAAPYAGEPEVAILVRIPGYENGRPTRVEVRELLIREGTSPPA